MTPSLIDRLFNDAPGEARDTMPRGAAAEPLARRALRRDLEHLLNAHRPYPDWAEQVEESAIAFGLPDITTEDFSSEDVRQRVANHIGQCLRHHEPRLEGVRVLFDHGAEPGEDVRFVIEARLRGDEAEQLMSFGARLMPVDRTITIEAT